MWPPWPSLAVMGELERGLFTVEEGAAASGIDAGVLEDLLKQHREVRASCCMPGRATLAVRQSGMRMRCQTLSCNLDGTGRGCD